jgi:uncharacterized protein (DUF2252 family)
MTDVFTEEPKTNDTVSDRLARGKEARRRAPRSSHGDWEPARDRPDPVGLLQSQEADRVPELVPIRHGRMLASEFSFFRGAALNMASDLSQTPSSGIEVQICGDAHLSNFGVFGTPERGMLFDVNDFDETLAGPWEWDVKRLAASLAVAGRDRGFTDLERTEVVTAATRSYRTAMLAFAGMSNLDVWYGRQDVSVLESWRAQMGRREKKVVQTTLTKAQGHDHLAAFAKLTTNESGVVRLREEHPLITPLDRLLDPVAAESLRQSLGSLLDQYASSLPLDRQRLLETFQPVQIARKVVGVGSVGTRCWIILLLGRDESDPLILQAKEAGPSVLEQFLAPSQLDHHGQRVVEGQRLMQAASDILLGWVTVNGIDGITRDFYVRQLWDHKGSVDIARMVPHGMGLYGELCGWTLARAHARSGDRIAIASYLGTGSTFDRAIARFAEAYAEQNEADHQALVNAHQDGRIEAMTGV